MAYTEQSIQNTVIENGSFTNNAFQSDLISDVRLPIKAVEKETGISKELLRMWERRYGFPAPIRDTNNDRMYPSSQVERLRVVRRLIDGGFRPGKIINLSLAELKALITDNSTGYISNCNIPQNFKKDLLNFVKGRNPVLLSQYLNHLLIRIGLEEFILTLMQHTNMLIMDSKMRGEINSNDESMYFEQVSLLVQNAIGNLAKGISKPKIMVTTPQNESHAIGSLMNEAILRIDQINAVNYGEQLSTQEMRKLILRNDVDIVLISFSGSFPTNRAIDFLEKLRLSLPIKTAIWATGNALHHTRKNVEGVIQLDEINDIRNRVLFWKRQNGCLKL